MLNLFFRQDCLSCKQPAFHYSKLLCQKCENLIILAGQPKLKFFKFYHHQAEKLIPLNYFYDFQGIIRKTILSGKFKFNLKAFQLLTEIILANHSHQLNFTDKLLTFVPTTYLRYCYRGFNQAHKIATQLTAGSSPHPQKLLSRLSYDQSQTVKSELQRRHSNQQFTVPLKHHVLLQTNPPKIMIIDDVCTTGTTLLNCAHALLSVNHNLQLEFLTIAYKRSYRDS